MSQILYIWDSNNRPINIADCTYIYWSEIFNIETPSISIVEKMESNSAQLKSEYLAFIHNLGNSKYLGKTVIDLLKIKDNLSYWWMTLLVEKSNWAKSPEIVNIIKLMTFLSLINEVSCTKIYIKSNNEHLVSSIRMLCKEKKIDFYQIQERIQLIKFKELKKSFIQYIPNLIKGYLWLFREIFLSIPFTLSDYEKKICLDSSNIFVSYLSSVKVDVNNCDKFNNSFWGPLPNHLSQNEKTATWVYLPSRRFKIKEIFTAFKTLKRHKTIFQNYVLLSSFFNWGVLNKILKDIFLILKNSSRVKHELKKTSGIFWPLIKNDVERSLLGVEMFSSVFYLGLFSEMKDFCDNQAKLIYLYENQPWEIALISSFKVKKNLLIGYAHSTIRYWDLRYFNDPRSLKSNEINAMPRPNFLAVNGFNDKSIMIESGYLAKEIKEVESLRYLYLNDLIEKSTNYKKDDKQILLVLGDYLKSDTIAMLSLLKSPDVKSYLNNHKIIIKPHPACIIENHDIDGINAVIEYSDLADLILTADIIFTGNVSSAAVEAYFLEKKIISYRNFRELDMSPLRGIEGIYFASDHESFKSSLKYLLSHDSPYVKKSPVFKLNRNLDSWSRILNL